jgi:hypothetical protein
MRRLSWLERLAESLDDVAGEKIRIEVMEGSEDLSSGSSPGRKAGWIQAMIERLEQRLDLEQCVEVMTGCSCHAAKPQILELKRVCEQTGDTGALVTAMQRMDREWLRRRIGQDEVLLRQVEREPFYNSPFREGDAVCHVVKPDHPKGYLTTKDPQKRRAHYCPCGWIRYGREEIPATYCYCGAGYYKSLWEAILNAPVRVSVESTVCSGDDHCRIAVHLPEDRT